MALELIINGRSQVLPTLDAGSSLLSVIEVLGLKPDRIAVEHNGTIASRDGWAGLLLEPGGKLEIVHFVGGGCREVCSLVG